MWILRLSNRKMVAATNVQPSRKLVPLRILDDWIFMVSADREHEYSKSSSLFHRLVAKTSFFSISHQVHRMSARWNQFRPSLVKVWKSYVRWLAIQLTQLHGSVKTFDCQQTCDSVCTMVHCLLKMFNGLPIKAHTHAQHAIDKMRHLNDR